jgi:hypothetical protein
VLLHVHQARLLVSSGGNITMKDRWGYSPLELAHKVRRWQLLHSADCNFADGLYVLMWLGTQPSGAGTQGEALAAIALRMSAADCRFPTTCT